MYNENNQGNNKDFIQDEKNKKKEKLDNSVKEVINKEIEDSLSVEKKEEKIYVHPSTELLNINNKTKLKSKHSRKKPRMLAFL